MERWNGDETPVRLPVLSQPATGESITVAAALAVVSVVTLVVAVLACLLYWVA
jgi:hypothetical protein